MSAAAGSELAYGGGENGPLQQAIPDAMLQMHDGVGYSDLPAPAGYQRPAAGNAAHSAGATASCEPFKRKRGRPRKFGPEPLAVMPPTQAGPAADVAALTLPPGFCPTTEGGGRASHQALLPLNAPHAKNAGLPGTSAKKLQPKRAAAPGEDLLRLKPCIFTVQTGEDIASRAMSFSCNGWAVCILSANGSVSNVTLRQGDSSTGTTVTYEGRFEILSLAGSYVPSENSGLSSRIGGLTVSLAGPDGRVLGGSVAGPLPAASPVQLVIGSFLSDGKEPDLNLTPGRLMYSAFAPSSSLFRGTLSESSGGHGCSPNRACSFITDDQPGFPNFPPWK